MLILRTSSTAIAWMPKSYWWLSDRSNMIARAFRSRVVRRIDAGSAVGPLGDSNLTARHAWTVSLGWLEM